MCDFQIVKLITSSDEAKTVINSKDDEGWAPLHSAASSGNAELVELLLTRGMLHTLVCLIVVESGKILICYHKGVIFLSPV